MNIIGIILMGIGFLFLLILLIIMGVTRRKVKDMSKQLENFYVSLSGKIILLKEDGKITPSDYNAITAELDKYYKDSKETLEWIV